MITNAAAFLRHPTPHPLIGRLPAGRSTPADLYPVFRRGAGSFLLESGLRPGAGSGSWGRYSFLGGAPYRVITAGDGLIDDREYDDRGQPRGTPCQRPSADPLADACALWRQSAPVGIAAPGLPPLAGGAVGYLGYGLSRRHHRGGTTFRPVDVPDVGWMFVEVMAAFDHLDRTVALMFCPPADRWLGESRRRLLAEGLERLHDLAAALVAVQARGDVPTAPDSGQPATPAPTVSPHEYAAMVERAKAYIADGDIFQANLAQRFTADVGDRDGFDWYRRLRAINPAPFAAYLHVGDIQIISSSPERLIRLEGREAETRPIAGTRPRGADASDDDRLTTELLLHDKERAEHLMLVDLERNDLGRVCTYGSVKVDELMVTERYSHVIHIVSNIRGTLRPEAGPADLLDAVFPGGTVTGVPKVRCLEIIEELEPVPRGLYTGAIGYLSWSGQMDWNIAIRTLVLQQGRLSFHAGAGIVADSIPEREYRETMDKAQALFEALK